MPKSLTWKLTLFFVFVAVLTAALVALAIRVSSADSLFQLIIDQRETVMQEALVDYYETIGSWDGIYLNWWELQKWSAAVAGEETGTGQGFTPDNGKVYIDQRALFGLADASGFVIVPVEPDYHFGEIVHQEDLDSGIAITVNGDLVGTLLSARHAPGFSPDESMFLERTNKALIYAMLGASAVALLMGIFLARTLTRPLKALTIAAQKIAQGDLEQKVKVKSNDEIGQLASAFNRMSAEVARVNQLRRQMTADIAHDLRTPLTVIAGYIESMRDGILSPTTQRLSLIYVEIERLQRLVGDLRMLTQADAGELSLNPQKIQPKSLLDRSAQLFQHHAEQQQVNLVVDTCEPLPEIYVDESRIMQVMDNLISNALRYTPSAGTICLGAKSLNGSVDLTVKDNGIGIVEEELPLIFDRFHRADKSRHTETGESGLGLSIVKALVEAHGGRVWAESAPNLGTTMHVQLPVCR